MTKILIIDDDKMMCSMLSQTIRKSGYLAVSVHDLSSGLKTAASQAFDIIFLDVIMPDGNGLDSIPLFRRMNSLPEIIIITGQGDKDGAELAIKSGAWDYIEKPFSIKKVRLSLQRAIQYREQKCCMLPPVALKRNHIIGESQKLQECFNLVAQAANSNANVLITGETGTGKELFARAVHMNSDRASKNFVVVDCAALPDSLVESMLLGHEKGAFTGANTSSDGLIMQADGGTLFLDEVGELPAGIQKAFLRVLQERRFRPLGSSTEVISDFRLVAATHRNLEEMVSQGDFRKDLLFRIQTITINLPALRERPDDISDIVRFHAARICRITGQKEKGFSEDFFQTLALYNWPGNVRELINTVERVISSAWHEPVLFDTHLPEHIRIYAARQKVGKKKRAHSPGVKTDGDHPPLPEMKAFLDTMKTRYLNELLSYTDGQIRKACKISGLSRAHLYKMLKDYGITSHKKNNTAKTS